MTIKGAIMTFQESTKLCLQNMQILKAARNVLSIGGLCYS